MASVLVCPSCGAEHGADARFCSACGLPLVRAFRSESQTPEEVELGVG